ncbi:1-acyl-sn-glycerol-3-phosphate acyltransferase [Hoylesella enoeca]|uniref:1-acyl-sn-glycerol-3-phosphate acyltransferase n=1 Tax=Hoylesella enoeca TaxID=76123 RepID=UPI00288B4AF6|nr:1-acyl-sn-glycerol-3-phosphate acyltransferase [Hoylesella enoeca]
MTHTAENHYSPGFFDDIRPYNDAEIPAAMHRIADSELLPKLAAFIFPDTPVDEIRSMLREIKTSDEFQHKVMYDFNVQIIKRSVTQFTCNGLQYLSPSQPYIFVSNHRDIVLDASLLQYALVNAGFPTCEITFGANLMCHPLLIDIGKSNKMFRVERGGNAREFYRSSLHLSQYIHYVLTHKKSSIWIAQRNGRTKNGIDATDQGLINMFSMAGGRDKIQTLSELHIVPVAVNYEWEPCDILKVRELHQARTAKYVKRPGEDIDSILTGILQPKGRVHIEVCEPLTADELLVYRGLSSHEIVNHVAKLIDRRIISHYRLMTNNYLAYDLMHIASRPTAFCTAKERSLFVDRMNSLPDSSLREIFLGIYANPVISQRTLK